jgi:hypothetical protein
VYGQEDKATVTGRISDLSFAFVGRVQPEQITFPDQPPSCRPVRVGGCEPEHGDLRRVA